MNYLVYLHKDRCTNEVFYVGIGDRGRAYDEKNRNTAWKQKIKDCYFEVEIIAKNLSKKLAYQIEMAMINLYGIENLVNKTKGGAGTLGYSHTIESKQKIGISNIGRKRTIESINKSINTRTELHSNNYKHIQTGKIIKGLKNACIEFGVNYKSEHQRIKRNSNNKNFELI
jgi:hypothetical protein